MDMRRVDRINPAKCLAVALLGEAALCAAASAVCTYIDDQPIPPMAGMIVRLATLSVFLGCLFANITAVGASLAELLRGGEFAVLAGTVIFWTLFQTAVLAYVCLFTFAAAQAITAAVSAAALALVLLLAPGRVLLSDRKRR